jgi:hypothetical protein
MSALAFGKKSREYTNSPFVLCARYSYLFFVAITKEYIVPFYVVLVATIMLEQIMDGQSMKDRVLERPTLIV